MARPLFHIIKPRDVAMLTHELSSPSDLKVAFQMMPLLHGRRLRRAAQALGVAKPPALDLDAVVQPPDSQFAKTAEEFLLQTHPDVFVGHGHRTYWFAAALAAHHKKDFDRELLYVASLLHDVGLTPEAAGDGAFELRGAKRAHAFCCQHGVHDDRAARIHEAIAWHTTLGDIPQRGVEGVLVQWGSGLDVVGLRAEQLHANDRSEIVRRFPRGDFKCAVEDALKKAAQQAGNESSLGPLMRLGFVGNIRAAPFAS